MNKTTRLHISPDNSTIFSGKYRDAIFGDNMIYYPNSDGHVEYDITQEYRINKSGYRGPELSEGIDMVVAGCSFTYGMGVPENGTWGSILANSLGMSYNNISQNGASIPWIVRQLFAYFKEYGNPKVLVCLFPNLTRTFFSSDSEILISDDGYVEDSTHDLDKRKSIYNTELSHIPANQDRPKYSKKPHSLEDVIGLDFIVQIAMQNIRMLEQYCKSSGIKFVWGSWSEAVCDMIEGQGLSSEYDFSHYAPTGYRLWNDALGCHQELLEKYGSSFKIGTDDLHGHPHFGVHRHVHFAEAFRDRLINE